MRPSLQAWVTDALFLPESRAAFRRLLNLGFTDALLARNPNPGYTFWDYQAGAWERNNGIRIDHVLLSPQAADLLRRRRHREGPARRRKTLGPCAGLGGAGRVTGG